MLRIQLQPNWHIHHHLFYLIWYYVQLFDMSECDSVRGDSHVPYFSVSSKNIIDEF